ncbi:hypothetical protein AOLI_G00008890 [Acnodon oligacanthus]
MLISVIKHGNRSFFLPSSYRVNCRWFSSQISVKLTFQYKISWKCFSLGYLQVLFLLKRLVFRLRLVPSSVSTFKTWNLTTNMNGAAFFPGQNMLEIPCYIPLQADEARVNIA